MILRACVSALCVLTTTSGANASYPCARPPASAAPDSRASSTPCNGTRTDSTLLPRPLPFFYDLFTFRHDRGGTMVVAAVAVPAGGLRSERRNDEVRYRFDVRLILADTARRAVFHTEDSVYVSLPRPLNTEHLLHTYVEIRAPPSAAMLQRVIVTDATRPGVGQLYRSPFPIPDYSGTDLMLSDVAFGLPDAEDGWTRRGVTLALLPTSQFPQSSFDVYYEIYNLPSGNPYETEISIEPLDEADGERRTVGIRFFGEARAQTDGSVSELRRVDSALPVGRYRLTVTVRDQISGRTAVRSRVVQVRGWETGTTLVPAMPYGNRSPGA